MTSAQRPDGPAAGQLRRIRQAAAAVLAELVGDPRFEHTSSLHVRVGGDVVVHEQLRGPIRNDVFSVTKTVLAVALARMAALKLLPDLDEPVSAVLPDLAGTPAARHTWRQLLTMTRGAATDGPWEVDEITALPTGQVRQIATAPQLYEPGTRFGYDNGSSHLLSAAATSILGEPVSVFAAREIFVPLGIADVSWKSDPDQVPYGYGHLRLAADELGRIGDLLWNGGRIDSERQLDPAFLAAMTRPQNRGGPPEGLSYGYQIWIDRGLLLAGGWAGQHVLVVPEAAAVVVTTGDPQFDPGPPARDRLRADWVPALALIREHLLPAIRDDER